MLRRSGSAEIRHWRGACTVCDMLSRIARLFVIKTKFEAFLVIYALATGGVERGMHYRDQYPGSGGWLLFAACSITVVMAGARILDSVERAHRD